MDKSYHYRTKIKGDLYLVDINGTMRLAHRNQLKNDSTKKVSFDFKIINKDFESSIESDNKDNYNENSKLDTKKNNDNVNEENTNELENRKFDDIEPNENVEPNKPKIVLERPKRNTVRKVNYKM